MLSAMRASDPTNVSQIIATRAVAVGLIHTELKEALGHSDRVQGEELAGGGWKRNMNKSEVVPTMKGKRPGLRPGGKGTRHRGGSAPLRRTFLRGMATIVRNCSAEKERYAQRGCPWADWPRNASSSAARCSELRWRRRRPYVARFRDAGDQFSAV